MEPTLIIRDLIISAPAILIAIVLHEISHGYIANKLGDPTAKMLGRLTLNPVAHIDLFGTILMPVMLFVFSNGQFIFGYAKPVPINPYNFKNPKRDMALSAAGGPVVNVLIALASAILLNHLIHPLALGSPGEALSKVIVPVELMLERMVAFNIILAAFNLMPIPPLDGGRVMMGLLPRRQADALGKIEPFGMIIILVLVVTGIARYIILPLAALFYSIIGLV